MKKFIRLTPIFLMFLMTFSSQTSIAQSTFPFEVKISGKGKKAIIFIPGFACSGDVWNETKASFEADFTCHTLTMAGFADAKPMVNPTFKTWEAGIAAYIKTNKIEKPIIVGHSMGGGLAMALAADYPDLIEKIVVVDALPCLSAMMDPSFQSKSETDCSDMVTKITATSDEQFYQMQKMSMAQLMADSSRQELVIGWSVKSDRKTFAEMYCDFSNTDLRNKIKAIKCPSLILLESYFANFKPAIKDQFKNFKTANLQYATKGLHFVMYDDKEWYDKQLNDFLKPK
jgi:pimeloyl-ACP methyl ester carboxylesterase